MFTYQLANMTRLENMPRDHLQSKKKLETEMEKLAHTENLEMCINQLANMRRP